MNNAAPALLALLLVCSLPAMVVAAGASSTSQTTGETDPDGDADVPVQSDPIAAENTSNRLPLDGDVTTDYAEPNQSLGTTLAVEDDAMRAEYDAFAFEQRFEDASMAEREAMIEDELDRIQDRVDELRAEREAAVAEHAAGERSTQQLFQTYVRTAADASQLAANVEQLGDFAGQLSGFSIRTESLSLQGKLEMYQSPVNDHLETSLRVSGDSGPPVAVRTSETGATIATIHGGEFNLETTRFDHRDLDAEDQLGSYSAAEELREQQYPWVDEVSSSGEGGEYTDLQLYKMGNPYDQGVTDLYVDGGTASVYHESQSLSLSQLPAESLEETWSADGLELAINVTPANGPIEVTVTEEATGEPSDGVELFVDGTLVGETDAEGTAWLVPPVGEYELTAQDGNATVTAALDGSA